MIWIVGEESWGKKVLKMVTLAEEQRSGDSCPRDGVWRAQGPKSTFLRSPSSVGGGKFWEVRSKM